MLVNGRSSFGIDKSTLAASWMIFSIVLFSFANTVAQECTSQAASVGYRDFSFGTQVYMQPTAEKPEHKLWWNDGFWWGSLWSTSAYKYRIHRFNVDSQCWTNVGPDIDDRPITLSDALWDGTKLYIASHIFITGSTGPARLYRYSYDSISKIYSLDNGFPAQVNSEMSETLTIAKDSAGKLWVTWQSGNKIMVNSSQSDDAAWGDAFQLPVQGADVSSDDISAIVAFGGNKIGILWSNQSDKRMYFAFHQDGASDNTWQAKETALGNGSSALADDHINLKITTDDGGNVYAATKTSLEGSSDPLIYLLKRGSNGSWSTYVVAEASEDHTRPILAVDTENREVYVFMARLTGSPRAIYYKKTSLDNIQFADGVGTEFIKSNSDGMVNNPTSMRQNVNSATGILILASDEESHYYLHNYMSLASGSGNTPPVAVASADPQSGIAPLPVSFSSSGSNDPDGTISSYTWTFGDGASSTEPNPSHTYNSAGNYSAILTVTDNGGATNNDAVSINVTAAGGNQPPMAVIYEPLNGSVFAPGALVTYSGDAIDTEDGILPANSFVWTAIRAWDGRSGGLSTGTKSGTVAAASQTGNYILRLQVTDSQGASATQEITLTVSSSVPTKPNAPSNLAANAVSASQIDLSWSDNASNENGFKIERRTAASLFSEIAGVGAGIQNYSDGNLSTGVTYFYRVRAHNSGGGSPYSNEANATPTDAPQPPAAPSNLTATAINSSQIDLSWADNANNEDGFKIERKTEVGGTYEEIMALGANATSYSNTGLAAETTYYYRVLAYNAAGSSSYSDEASATTQAPPQPPNSPSNLAANAISSSQIDLAWSDNANNEDGFKIERRTGTGGTYAEIMALGTNATSYSNTGLAAETIYYYRVRAYNAADNSSYSDEASATTPPAPQPPNAPSNLAANAVSNSQINLSWGDNASDEDGFKIERKIGAGGTYAEIMALGANATSYSNTGLAAGTTYYYRVRAFNGVGNSAFSNEANATTTGGGSSGNLALNKPATASSTYSGKPANNAVDGSTSTYWRSGSVSSSNPVAWLRVDLGSSQLIGRAVVKWNSSYFAKSFEVQVSDNDVSWVTAYSTTAGKSGTQDFTFAQTTGRYVRLYMSKNQKSNYRINEFEVYSGGPAKMVAEAQEKSSVPQEIELRQNHPNPFNPSTSITFSLPQAAHVTLKVYNLMGAEVADLVNGMRSAGIHSVIFEPKELPSGAYFYELKAGEVRQVRRLLYLR